ncbi:MAG TPA: aminotransferase class I/II-fold pyridoxal phosphate-dependent enzyme [Candidatus Bathyarchaeia archaeon]
MARIKVTERVKNIEYAIRDIIAHTEHLLQTGKKLYCLNIGDPGAFDFPAPEHVKQALCKAVEENDSYYSPSEGLPELREAIAKKEKRVNNVEISPDDVLITSGISEGIEMTLAALVEQGDEILCPGPTYPPYISYAKFFGGTPIPYETIEEEGWQPDVDDLRSKISGKTRALVITNPNNPTGAVYGKKIVKQMLDLAGEHNLLVITDEIYDQLTYTEDFASTAYLAKDIPVVGLNGFSKVYRMTGWRLGYVYFKGQGNQLTELKQVIEKECRIRICANTPVQKAGTAALNGPQDHITRYVAKLRERGEYAWKRLNEIEGISCAKPEGAFYVFPRIHEVGSRWKTDLDFVLHLLKETGVLTVNGSGFDAIYGAGHFRVVFLPTITTLEEAFNELEHFMKKKVTMERPKRVGHG